MLTALLAGARRARALIKAHEQAMREAREAAARSGSAILGATGVQLYGL